MKYDFSKPLTKGAKRTLEAFSREMFALLSIKSFEKITVGQLCEGAQYPRATFYNYFDDKYDLLDYCWQRLALQIGFDEYHHAAENEMLYLYFDRIYDFTKENEAVIRKVLSHNSEVGYMFSSFRNFLNHTMRLIFQDCPDAAQKDVPNELLADHYSNTLFLIWQWTTIKNANCTKGQAHNYLCTLVGLLRTTPHVFHDERKEHTQSKERGWLKWKTPNKQSS